MRHHVRRWIGIAFGLHGGRATRRPSSGRELLHGFARVLGEGLDIDALAGEDGVEVVEGEGGVMAAQQRGALQELMLEALDMAARGERLAMTILLVALDARRGAGGAPRVLRVALAGGQAVAGTVGANRRDLP